MYSVEYTVSPANTTDRLNAKYITGSYYYLPIINPLSGGAKIPNDENIEVTLLDGSVVMGSNVAVSTIKSIKVYYAENSKGIRFMGTDSNPHRISSLINVDIQGFTSMERMFCCCPYLTEVNTSNWNVSKITVFGYMFYMCTSIKCLDLSSFKTRSSSSSNGYNMFDGWTSSQVVYISNDWTLDISSFDATFINLSAVKKIAVYTFDNTISADCPIYLRSSESNSFNDFQTVDTKNGNITHRTIFVSNDVVITKMQIYYQSSLLTVEYMCIDENIISCSGLVANATNLTYINTDNWNTKNTKNMDSMFVGCKSLTDLNLSHLDTSQVEDMRMMFWSCKSLQNLNVIGWNTSKVVDMYGMFGYCPMTTLDISSFDTSSVTEYDSIFTGFSSTQSVYVGKKWTLGTDFSASILVTNTFTYTITKYKFNQNTYADYLPTFNSGFTDYLYSDMIDTDGYIIRTVGNDSGTLPTLMRFGESGATDKSLSLLEVFECNTNKVTDMSDMFYDCKNLTSLDLSNFNTQNVTDISGMFGQCSSLTSLDLSSFNTEKVTNMRYMFYKSPNLTSLNLSSFNTQNVTMMNFMFYDCKNLTSLDLSNFNTQNVTNVDGMFTGWTSSQTVYIGKKWTIDTSSYSANFIRNVTYKYMIAKYTFNNSVADCLPTITGATTSQWGYSDKVDGTTTTRTIGTDEELTITNISFRDKKSLLTLDYLNFTNAITNTSRMFQNCTNLTSINTHGWDTSNITSMNAMFNSCTSLASLDMSNWNVGNVNNMSYMFYACEKLTTLDLSAWNVGKVTNMTTMFSTCTRLTTLNVSGWDTSKVTSMGNMFQNCRSLTTLDLSHFNVDSVTNMGAMFAVCASLTSLNISTWNTSKVSDMSSMFQSCSKLTTLDLSHFKVDKVTSMRTMFSGCSKLTTLDLSNWDTSSVTSMRDMFSGCSALTTLDLSHFNVHGVTSMVGMFYYCVSLTTLNLSNWSASAVTDMSAMFQNCAKLTTLDLSSWKVDSVTSMGAMFFNCGSLTTLDLSNWNTSKVTNMSNMFNGCSALTTVDLSNFDTSKVSAWGSPSGTNKLTNIGLVYASSSTINSIVTNWLGTSVARNVYYMDAELSELTTQKNITYLPYSQSVLSCSEEITLRSNGDVYDELDLLTGQLIQRIGEDNEILEEEIVRAIELDGEIGFYENSYIHTSSNEITPEFEFQPTLTNCYAVSDLKPNTQYTVLFEGNPTLMSLGGTTIENPISKTMITSGEVDDILWFDTSVSKIMILEGDLTNRDIEYFTGVKSSQKIEVQLRGNTPYFAKGGRK